ncbi:hypothetical protein ACJX0J_008189, partial [Zea mays]
VLENNASCVHKAIEHFLIFSCNHTMQLLSQRIFSQIFNYGNTILIVRLDLVWLHWCSYVIDNFKSNISETHITATLDKKISLNLVKFCWLCLFAIVRLYT